MGAGEGDAAAGNKEKGGGGGVDRTSLDGVRDKNVMQLKKLNTALFPVRYNEKYYHDTIASKEFSKLGARPPSLPNLFLVPPSTLPLARRIRHTPGRARCLLPVVSCIGMYFMRFQPSDLRTGSRKASS